MYGWDCHLPIELVFYLPTVRDWIVESDYTKELFAELKVKQQLAKQILVTFKCSEVDVWQGGVCQIKVIEWDLVMFKVKSDLSWTDS